MCIYIYIYIYREREREIDDGSLHNAQHDIASSVALGVGLHIHPLAARGQSSAHVSRMTRSVGDKATRPKTKRMRQAGVP